MRARSDWRGYLFVAPATIYLLVFSFVPMVIAAYLSVHRWHLLKEDHLFVGAGNYVELLHNPFFRNAVWNTAVFAALSVPLGMIVALAVAILVNQKLRGVAVFRTLYYIPAVSSGVALSMVWIWILLPQDGLINYVLRCLGYSGDYDFLNAPSPWRLLPAPAMLCLVAMSMWIGLGPRMVIFLAGLQGIPDSLYESAEIDGCNGWQRFRYITLPLLMPTTFFVLITSTIAAFQLFTQVYIMTRGGPQRATDVVVYHIYKEAWHRLQIGMASAQSYVLFGIILLIAIVQFALMRRRVQDAGEW
ncbi:MAG: carbohydrate ABC transporter permease [Phycisphaerae bacterium]